MRFACLIFGCVGLILLLLTGFLSILRQQAPPSPYIFFVASEKSGTYVIYRMNSDGSQKKRLVGTANDTFLWQTSSNGQWILCYRPPHYFRLKFDGSELHSIHQQDTWGFSAQWTKTNQWIIFETNIDTNSEIYRSDINGKSLANLTLDQADDRNPQISPDGKWILFSSERDGNHEIYKMKLGGSSINRLTENNVLDLGAMWSPDGEWILYRSLVADGTIIHTMKNDGTQTKALIHLSTSLDSPQWSNDGQWIIYSTRLDNGNYQLYKLKPDSSQLTPLTSNETDVRFPQWSPDGQWILFEGKQGIHKIRPNGSEITKLTSTSDFEYGYNALWSPIIDMAWRGERLLLVGLGLLALPGVSYRFRKFKDTV